MGGRGGLAFELCFCVLLRRKGRWGTAAGRRWPGLCLFKVQVEVRASPRHPHAFRLVLLRRQTLHGLIPETERQRIHLLRPLKASASPFLLLHLMFTAAPSPAAHARDDRATERGWRGKDGKSRTDAESWMSRTESEKNLFKRAFQHASFRPPQLRSTSPFSFLPYQT